MCRRATPPFAERSSVLAVRAAVRRGPAEAGPGADRSRRRLPSWLPVALGSLRRSRHRGPIALARRSLSIVGGRRRVPTARSLPATRVSRRWRWNEPSRGSAVGLPAGARRQPTTGHLPTGQAEVRPERPPSSRSPTASQFRVVPRRIRVQVVPRRQDRVSRPRPPAALRAASLLPPRTRRAAAPATTHRTPHPRPLVR